MSESEIVTILLAFHDSPYKNFKYFYLHQILILWKDLFPKALSYNRFVELMQSVMVKLCLFLKVCGLAKSTGISYIDSTPIRVCKNKRISNHKVFKGLAQLGKSTMGWFFGFKLHLIITEKGEIIEFMITAANVDDRNPLKNEKYLQKIFGKLFGDKGDISQKIAEILAEKNINLITGIRNNMKNSLMNLKDKILLRKRSIIETVNGKLKEI